MQIGRRSGDPVFLDGTGRRRRLFVVAGSVGGLVLVLAVLALLAGFTGVGAGSVPGWPGAGQAQGAAPKPDPSGSTPASADPLAGATASADANQSAAGVPPSTTATTTVAPSTTTPTPVSPSHRKVPTQTPTAHPSKRH